MNSHEEAPDDEQPELTFWGWVSTLDPALVGYANRQHHSQDEHRAFLMGRWCGAWDAVWSMSQFCEPGTDVEQLLASFVHTQRALLRRRTPHDFVHALERYSAESLDRGERREWMIAERERNEPQHDQGVDPFDRPEGGRPRE